MKGNKAVIKEAAARLGLEIGCYHKGVDSLTQKELNKVLGNMEFQSDTDVKIKRKPHVIEIDIVENEIDLNVLSKAEFIDRYGNERYE